MWSVSVWNKNDSSQEVGCDSVLGCLQLEKIFYMAWTKIRDAEPGWLFFWTNLNNGECLCISTRLNRVLDKYLLAR